VNAARHVVVMSREAYIASSRGDDARSAYVASAAHSDAAARLISKKCPERFKEVVGML
jgi:hypothetical protein